jgi:hypothetical protein
VSRYFIALGVLLYGFLMAIWPRPFGRLLSAISKLDPATWLLDPKQREVRNGFIRAAGVVIICVALYLLTLV